MRFRILLTLGIALLLIQTAPAQVITQTPQPDIPEPDDALVEIVEPVISHGFEGGGDFIQTPRSGTLLFAGFDQNFDYVIDAGEVEAGIAHAFERADTDKSGLLSLIELEGWRALALGSENATPTKFTFAPNFARTVSREKFSDVLGEVAHALDKDDLGETDGKIAFSDLLQNYRLPHVQKQRGDNCIARLREERRRGEQQCRTRTRR